MLTLAKRGEVIEKSEKGKSARAIAVERGVGKTQIQNELRNKESMCPYCDQFGFILLPKIILLASIALK